MHLRCLQFVLLSCLNVVSLATKADNVHVYDFGLDLVHDLNHTLSNECDIDIIFVHGLNGSDASFANRQYREANFFNLLNIDPQLKKYNKRIWLYKYPNAFKHSSQISLEERAEQLLQEIVK